MSSAGALPRELGKYRLEEIVGTGSMGVVYRAYDPLIERTLALKTMRRDQGDPVQARELLQRFRKEAQAAGRLTHPNIVAVYDYGESDEVAYIAMEFVDGAPLSQQACAGPCTVSRVLDWMSDLLAALAYSHAHGVVHRDIKPANLLVTRDDRIKVGDFGIARLESSTMTGTGAMIGTPSYMSPEQFSGEAVDARSDLFSAGIVLYQLLTGQRPFAGSSATVMRQILLHTPPPPSALNAALPAALDEVVLRALAKSPDARFASATGFLQALTDASHRIGLAARRGSTWDDADATVLAAAGACPEPAPAGTAHRLPVEPPHWKQAALPQVQALLTRQIGPLAPLLLRRIMVTAADFPSLRRQLLPHIPSVAARSAFERELAAIERDLHAPVSAPEDRAPSGARHGRTEPDFQAALTALLAAEIGPIAAIVVRRALREAEGAALLESLARRIEVPAARTRFVDAARRLIAQG